MSDACKREWRFYLYDIIDFAERVLAHALGVNFTTVTR